MALPAKWDFIAVRISSADRTRFQMRSSSMRPKKSWAPYSLSSPFDTSPAAPSALSKHPPTQSCSRPMISDPPEGMSFPWALTSYHTRRPLSYRCVSPVSDSQVTAMWCHFPSTVDTPLNWLPTTPSSSMIEMTQLL